MPAQEKWTPEQGRQHFHGVKRENQGGGKFHNIPVKVDNIKFDSIKEADYYGRLKIRVRAGLLVKFEVHKRYELRVNGILISTYEADFVLYFPDGTARVVDVKSEATEGLAMFRIKKNLMFACHGITVFVEK